MPPRGKFDAPVTKVEKIYDHLRATKETQKLEENDRCFMNGHFHRANQKNPGRIDAEKSAGFESANRKIHLQAE